MIKKTEAEWQQQLSPQAFDITRKKATERAFSGEYNDCKIVGTYHCLCCGVPLFTSHEKFDSGSGWPSYWQPIDDNAIHTETDHAHGMRRVEVLCAHCDAHLGHVFEDGPQPTGLRYCINSASLNLQSEE